MHILSETDFSTIIQNKNPQFIYFSNPHGNAAPRPSPPPHTHTHTYNEEPISGGYDEHSMRIRKLIRYNTDN